MIKAKLGFDSYFHRFSNHTTDIVSQHFAQQLFNLCGLALSLKIVAKINSSFISFFLPLRAMSLAKGTMYILAAQLVFMASGYLINFGLERVEKIKLYKS